MGNRNIQVVPAAVSLTVSFISSILILGEPAEMYTFGGQLMISKLGWMFGAALSTVVFVPVLHPLKLTSVNKVCACGHGYFVTFEAADPGFCWCCGLNIP